MVIPGHSDKRTLQETTASHDLEGCLDGVLATGELYGWAYSLSDSLRRIDVYLTVDDIAIGKTIAGLMRDDLYAAGKTDGTCAFEFKQIPMPVLKQLKPGSKVQAFFDAEQRHELTNSPLPLTETLARQLYWFALDPGREDLTLDEQKFALLELLNPLSNCDAVLGEERVYICLLGFCRNLLRLGHYQWLQAHLALDLIQARCCLGHPAFELILIRAISSQATASLASDELQLLETALFSELHSQRKLSLSVYSGTMCDAIVWGYRDCHLMLLNDTILLSQLSFRFLYLLGIALASLYQDFPFAANVLDFIRRNNAYSNDLALLEQCGKINRFLGRNYEAMQDFAAAIKNHSESAFVYQETAALQTILCEGRVNLIRQSMPRILAMIFRSFQLDPHRGGKLQYLADNFLRQFFQSSVGHTEAMAKAGDIATALQERREDLAALLAAIDAVQTLAGQGCYQGSAASKPAKRRFGHVLFIGSKDLWQCYQYRVQQKMDQAHTLGYQTAYRDINTLDDEAWKRDMAFTDALYICRVPAVYTIFKLVAYAHQLQLPVIYDIDDYLFDERYFPAPLESYAGTIDEEFHTHLVMDNPFFESALHLADAITCSTQPLAERITDVVGPDKAVAVHPNLLTPSLHLVARQWYKAEKETKTIELFYGSATKAHKQVIYEVFGPALVLILERFPAVKFTAFGYFQLPAELESYADRIEFREPTSNRDYYLKQLSHADINIAVLEQDPFTDCKSEIKWLEAAVFGIPSIVTPTGTYRKVVQAEREVLFAATTEEWVQQLTRLVESVELRQRIGENARQYAQEHYNPGVGANILQRTLSAYSEPTPPTRSKRQKSRLLYVNVWFTPQAVGGATRVFESHVRMLVEAYGDDYDVYVLTSQLDSEHFEPYSIEQFLYGPALVTRLNVPLRDWSDIHDEAVYAFCVEFYGKYGFDLIHFHALPILTGSVVDAALALKIPYLITLHDGWWLSKYLFLITEENELINTRQAFSEIDTFARQQPLYALLNSARAVLAVSDKFRDIYVDAGITQTQTNENGLALFPVLPRIPSTPPTAPKVRVAHIGGASYHKGFDLFREAVVQTDLKHIEVHIIDHSLESGQVYHRQWGSTPVIFRAKYKQSGINAMYAAMDVLVAPSIWPESYGLVTREAAYAGVWVIASDRGAVGDCVEDGVNGRVVPVDDASALQAALLEIDADPERFLVQCPQKSVRTVAEQVAECVALYKEILAGA
ncbi:MAG: glycosyltransferase [Methylovulum sp.]|uniref:glycosyltransferase n=1 Tax=Methylovulum sp. TaxID=1916980 RepID=UPI002608343B|nr:glycosyltransferase [Methylovulum sp.]MDD2723669.1 glycosyltransferase [Methylovulum sp.]MDD5125431.1 glycosyltransferase [Methylovulum sp.]